jgi:adenosylcobyric acid synthase
MISSPFLARKGVRGMVERVVQHPAMTIMVQGTASSVGKSLLVTALCRIFRQDGHSVAPFKAQNMSLNSFVTPDGAEIGRAQAVQAEAAMVTPSAHMNPILLKPEVDYRSQLVVMGRPRGHLESRNFNRRKEGLWGTVTESLDRLRAEFEVVVIEGAGSPAEINLRRGDIVNMEVALYARSPVLLVGDIDKGGVFASLYGTVMLLASEERELVRGTVLNKFRGDVSILRPGLSTLEKLTGVPVLGVVPYFDNIYVPEEDSPAGQNTRLSADALIDVAVIALPHIANFDDFDPLAREQGVGLRYVRSQGELGAPDLVIVPGTKTTVSDLAYLRGTGMAAELTDLAAGGTPVIGICGGYQMIGRWILDPEHVEADRDEVPGLGLLPVVTRFEGDKQTSRVSGRVTANHGLLAGSEGLPIEGYEIHMGATAVEAERHSAGAVGRPFHLSRGRGAATQHGDGVISLDGWIMGTYVHGLFHNAELRRNMLRRIAARKGVSLPLPAEAFSQSSEYDKLAHLVRTSLDMNAVYRMMGLAVEGRRDVTRPT